MDVELSDFDTGDNNLVIEEFFDIQTFEEQTAIEKRSDPQENTNINKD
ncbi:18956_t:CDS:1, partial [Racocetra fulgida]